MLQNTPQNRPIQGYIILAFSAWCIYYYGVVFHYLFLVLSSAHYRFRFKVSNNN